MQKDKTLIVFVIDRSGSMVTMEDEAIGGFNAFVEEQKNVPGEAAMTLIQFDNKYEVVYDALPLSAVPALTKDSYRPRSTTALFDAVGKAIVDTGNMLQALPEHKRPEHVIFVVLTDGAENASKEYTQVRVQEMIRHQEEKYSWHFCYLAAGVDACKSVSSIASNVRDVNSFKADGESLTRGLKLCSFAVRNLRTGRVSSS